jgi:hypothetical protein
LSKVDVRTAGPGIFGTLTYPEAFPLPDSEEIYKAHLDAFAKRFLRAFPRAGMHWKLEFQRCRACKPDKGTAGGCICGKHEHAPHFHPIFWNIPTDKEWMWRFKLWVSQHWFEVVGSGDQKHLNAGTRCEVIASKRGMLSYVGGYQSKDDQSLPGFEVGRYWGVYGRSNIPYAQAGVLELEEREGVIVRRIARGFMRSQNRQRRLRALDQQGLSHTLFFTGGIRALRKKVPDAAAFKIPPKIRLRNNDSISLFCDADFWAAALERLFVPGPVRCVLASVLPP